MKEQAQDLMDEIVTFGGYQISGPVLAGVIRKVVSLTYEGTGSLPIAKLTCLSDELEKL
jgi:hypothetical protein